jgi:uncharacterized protein (TIGR03086 family)
MSVDVVRLDAAAVRASADMVSRIGAADLGRPTPCAGWSLADLLAHMTSQHNGFAAAAAGDGADPRHWATPDRPPGDLAADYRRADYRRADYLRADYLRAADRVCAAFAAPGALGRAFCVLPISGSMTFPAAQAIAFHLVDYVVHGWDVARSLGLPYELPPDVLDAALRVALAVPDGTNRLTPGAAFAPRIPGYKDDGAAGPLDRIVALLGRRPDWSG